MPDGRRSRRGVEREAALDEREAEIAELEPFVGLAREIRREVDRIAAEGSDSASLTEAIERIPRQERERAVQVVFDRLTPSEQWSVLERAFGAAEVREHLRPEYEGRIEDLRRSTERREVVDAARARLGLDTDAVPDDDQVVLGLFREGEVRAVLARGQVADSCARRLVLRRTTGGFRVIEDVFNPRGGYFVTRDYDEDAWRRERLAPHSIVRVGSLAETPTGPTLDPVIYAGGRVDVETDAGVVPGHLHLGYLELGDLDVFAS